MPVSITTTEYIPSVKPLWTVNETPALAAVTYDTNLTVRAAAAKNATTLVNCVIVTFVLTVTPPYPPHKLVPGVRAPRVDPRLTPEMVEWANLALPMLPLSMPFVIPKFLIVSA